MLWRLFLHSPPSSLVSFLFLLLFPLTLRSALPPPSTVSSDGSLPKQRVILAFPFGTGCAHTSSGSGGDYPMLLAKEVRESVMRQLDAKVADFLQRLAVGGVLTGQGHNSQDVSLKTRYLSGLQMEVTEVPQGMHAADMVELARTIDCVQDVYEDSNKYAIPDDDSIVLDQDSNLIQQPRGNNPENSLPLDEISAPPVRNLQLHQRLDPLAFVRSVEEGFTPCQADPSLCLGSEITSTSLVEHENRAGTEGVVSLKAEQSVKVETASPSDGGLMAGQIGGEHGGGVSGSWKPPTDTLFASQWSLQGSEPMSTQVEKVWPWWTGASNPLIVAVIDSGCDLSHPDLKNRLWKNPGEICGDGIDNDGNGFVDDCHGYVSASQYASHQANLNSFDTLLHGALCMVRCCRTSLKTMLIRIQAEAVMGQARLALWLQRVTTIRALLGSAGAVKSCALSLLEMAKAGYPIKSRQLITRFAWGLKYQTTATVDMDGPVWSTVQLKELKLRAICLSAQPEITT
eukprot:GHVS01103143.1.p1 GENE.GHVS01103143.1~~GHVS01103143.1.p1  ORF type:complete len:514 (-),score=59.93 GHVS01103143.1:830-2371(-)